MTWRGEPGSRAPIQGTSQGPRRNAVLPCHVLQAPSLVHEKQRIEALVRRQRPWPSGTSSAGARHLETGLRSLADEIPLELGKHGQELKVHHSAGRRRVDRVLKRLELNASLSQFIQQTDQVAQGAAEPVDLPDYKYVALIQGV